LFTDGFIILKQDILRFKPDFAVFPIMKYMIGNLSARKEIKK